MNNEMADAGEVSEFCLRQAMDFCDHLFGYLYIRTELIRDIELKEINPFFNNLEVYLVDTTIVFREVFCWILSDFPFRGTDQVQVRYMVKFCSLLRTSDMYHSFLISCAFIYYAITRMHCSGCYRLLNMGPFSAFILLKRQLQTAGVHNIDGLNFWVAKLNQKFNCRSVTNLEDLKRIDAIIQMYLDFPETSLMGGMKHQFAVLQDDEINLLAVRLVPTMSFEEYALQPNAGYEMCKLCQLKCFVYNIMLQKSYPTLCSKYLKLCSGPHSFLKRLGFMNNF